MTEVLRARIGRVELPDGFKRDRAVKPENRSEGSDAKYDASTFFYSTVRHGPDVVIVAPKLLNFRTVFAK